MRQSENCCGAGGGGMLKLLTPAEAAALRGVALGTIINWCEKHGLRHERVGRGYAIYADALEAFQAPKMGPKGPRKEKRDDFDK